MSVIAGMSAVVGANLAHDSAISHVSGESVYIDDRLKVSGELLVGYVGSPVAAGLLKSIDCSEALQVVGVKCILTANDIVHNKWGTIFRDQPLLVQDEIGYYDEPIAIIAAENASALAKARSLIEFNIEKKEPILQIDKSILNKNFLYEAVPFIKGDAAKELSAAPLRLKGELFIGGQEHFYLENQASIVYPLENDCYEVHSSSQHPSETQHVVAEALGLNLHQVSCIVKRMGGGFGGKESQAAPFAAYAALVAKKTGRPARMVISKDEDMQVTGKRHPFKVKYEVGFNQKGEILVLVADLFADGGAYCDLSSSILERAMFHIDGAYYLPSAKIQGFVCKTNTASNTAFRGFGGPQGTFVIESIIEEMSQVLQKDSYDLRQLNCYQVARGKITQYGQTVEEEVLPELFKQLRISSNYDQRKSELHKKNQSRGQFIYGLSSSAVKFGISFTARFLNQGNALVNIHKDGTVQVSTGATEMGQGVNTKIAQIVASELGLPISAVKVMPTSTEKNHNTSPTAASSGADINGAAAMKAVAELKIRLSFVADILSSGVQLKPNDEISVPADYLKCNYEFKNQRMKNGSVELELVEVIQAAYMNRISLGEYAHFKTEGINFNKKTGTGQAFKYFTNGVAVTEVEIDRDTGQTKVKRVDLLMDIGKPINVGIDRGQIFGAFVQGMGWVTSENLVWSSEGKLLTHSPTTYKIPNIQDTPREFNVEIYSQGTNDFNILKSKAVGEPPFLLGISVWTSIKNAIQSVCDRPASGLSSPATNEAILMELVRQ
jgi:xanthine dehydrogenase large subunit